MPTSATQADVADPRKFPGAAAFECTGREGTGPGVAGNGTPGRFPDFSLWQEAGFARFEHVEAWLPFGSTGQGRLQQGHLL